MSVPDLNVFVRIEILVLVGTGEAVKDDHHQSSDVLCSRRKSGDGRRVSGNETLATAPTQCTFENVALGRETLIWYSSSTVNRPQSNASLWALSRTMTFIGSVR